jgi:hypothetical protein
MLSWAEKNPDKFWIDLRAEGRSMSYYIKHPKNDIKKMMDTMDQKDQKNHSCQLEYELDNGIIQQGNKIIAYIGSQLLLNYLRDEPSVSHMSIRI